MDEIQSAYSGDFVSCKCRAQSDAIIDEIYQMAIRGNPGKYVEADDGDGYKHETSEGHKMRCDLEKKHGCGISIDSTPYYTRVLGSGPYTVVDPGDEIE